MNTTEWTNRISTADRYLEAQYAFMAAATSDDASLTETLARLDDVRRVRTAFLSMPPAAFIESRQFSESEASDAVIFLEKSLKARKNESLLDDWIITTDLPAEIASLERSYSLDADPDIDIFFVGGSMEESLFNELSARKYKRIIRLSVVCADGNIDETELMVALKALPDIVAIRPARFHYVNVGIDEKTSDQHIDLIKQRLKLFYVSRNTNVLMAPLWTTHILKNIPVLMERGRSSLAIKNSFEGSIAVVIGAGPSLDEILPAIKTLQRQVIIICAFKALRAVTAAGIDPDIVVCLDPKQTARHLQGVDFSKIGAFAVEASSNIEMLQQVTDCPLLPFVASDIPLALIRETGALELPVMSTGGSALHGALHFATLVGCTTIYFAGADFGFPGNRLYGTGAGTGDRFEVTEDGKSYLRTPVDSHKRGGDLYPTLANDGSEIGASLEMVQFREWVESYIEMRKGKTPHRFFNLSKLGAVIAGAPFKSVISGEDLGTDIKRSLRDVVMAAPSVSKLDRRGFNSMVSRRTRQLRDLRRICDEILNKADAKKDWTRQLLKLQKKCRKTIEVSLLVNRELIALDEYSGLVKDMGPSIADDLLIKLVRTTQLACNELLTIYDEL